MTNHEKFTAAYTEALFYYVNKNPDDYSYPVEQVPVVVAKMVPAYARGSAMAGPAMSRAMIKLGWKGGAKALKTYLAE